MIDTKELRRLAQAVQTSPRNIHERVNAIHNLHDALPSGVVLEILDRLEAAESDAIEQARLNGIGAEKELALMAKLEAAEKERDEFKRECFGHISDNSLLRTKINAMEKQEPVGKFIQHPSHGMWEQDGYSDNPDAKPLYLAPGAQPAPSFADAYQGAMENVAIWKKRAREAEDLNRKFVAEVNGPAYMGEPAQPTPIIPEGWKLVPIEPTPGMIDAAEYVDWGDADVRGSCINAWDRMLAAAPEVKP